MCPQWSQGNKMHVLASYNMHGDNINDVASYYNFTQKETRRIYKILMDEDPENFEGWKIEPG